MPDVSVPWGPSEYRLGLPEHWTIAQVATSSLRPAAGDWKEALARCLDQPATGLPLGRLLSARRDGRIVLVVEDLTRHSPLADILAILRREIEHAGIAPERLEFVFATGMHPPLTAAEAAGKLGPAAEGIARRCNPWRDKRAYVSVGRVEGVDVQIDRGVADADLRILVSSVSPHLQAGFGGGYKMLVPGCASLATIRQLHRQGAGRGLRAWVGTDGEANPMRKVIDGAGALADGRKGTSFSLQYVLDDRDLPTLMAAGEPMPTQQMLAKQCAVACGVVMNQPADVLITNAHPRDFDLWQCFKSIPNTMWAARPNGVVICLARCPAGVNGMTFPRVPMGQTWVRRLLRWFGPDALAGLAVRVLPRLAGEAAFFVRFAARAVHRNPILLVSPALHEAGVRFPGLEIFGDAESAVAAAQRLLGPGPQRVVVFPSGGATYPVLPGPAEGPP